jgi:hypothetical protein
MNRSMTNSNEATTMLKTNFWQSLTPGTNHNRRAQDGRATTKSLLLVVLSVCALFLTLPVQSQAQTWMDAGWAYRSQVNVNNPNGAALTDFQVRIPLDGSFDFSKASAGGADVRVTGTDGVSQVPFWIEQWDPVHSTASIWAKLPSLPASGTSVYLYYGNAAATTASDGNGTFEFFDDFENTGSVTQGYFNLSTGQTAMLRDQDWESSPPHTLSVVQANSGGYTYWGYYGLVDCGGVGLAFSNDLANWTKAADPIRTNGRWPSVLLVNGVYYMMYDKDYCTTPQVVLAESNDGINFTDIKTIVQPQPGLHNQNPNLFFNTNDGKYYLYWYRGDDNTFWEIHVRSSATIEGLDDTSTEQTILTSNQTLAAPDMLYYGGTYFLSTEVKATNGDWATQIYSGNSPTSGFVPLPGNPILANGSACFFQHIFNNTLHGYTCKDTANFWTLEHHTASLSSRAQFLTPSTSKWHASGGTWLLVPDTQQDGSQGTVVQGNTFARQILSSLSYNSTDYVVQAYGKQVGGNVWGIAARVQNDNSYYSTNLYDNTGITTNLFAYSWVNNTGQGATATLGSAGVGQVNPNTWYKLTMKVHGTAIQVYKDDVLQIQSADSSLPNGGVALYGEGGGLTEYNNVLVRKYAGTDPTATLDPNLGQVLTSLTLNPNTVAGGNTSLGTVVLAAPAPDAGAEITLTSSNPSLVNVPPTMTIPAGETSDMFFATTGQVQFPTLVTITASYQGAVQTATLTVSPLLYSLSISPSTVLGGSSATGTVLLSGPAPPDGISVALSSNSPVASVPASVVVSAGATSATFPVSTTAVATNTTATITATLGSATQSAAISVTPMLTSVSFNPATVLGGNGSTGTVTLAAGAPAGGITVGLTSANPSVASVPASVFVPAGASSATFAISTSSVASASLVAITASYGGATQTASLTVSSVGGVWFDPGWAYRSAVNISNAGGTALSGFQVQVTLGNTFDFTRVRSDAADLRFTDADGITPIPFWIENWNAASQTASLWVRVPSIPSAGTTIYFYYGNSNATTSTASGDATFEFFDDFGSGSLNTAKWTAFGGTWTTINDVQLNGVSGGVAQGTTQSRQVLVSSYSGTDYVAHLNAKQVSGRNLALGVRATNVSNLYSINVYDDLNFTSNMYVYSWVNNPGGGATRTLGSANIGDVNPNLWYKLIAKVHGSSIDIYRDNVLRLQVSDSALATGGIALYGENGTIAEFDNAFVRKYTTTDPVATVNGGPQQPFLSLSLSPTMLDGGASAQGTVVLANPAPAGGVMVSLTSSDTSLATVPPSVTVAAGSTTANFSVGTTAVSTTTSASISASANGTMQTVALTINPPTLPSLVQVSVDPTSVVGGSSATGGLSLSGPAPAGGAVVMLSSSNLAVQVPATVTVPANAAAATFAVTSDAVGASTVVTVTGTYNGASVSATLTVNPPSLTSLILSPNVLVGGGTSTGIVMLSSAAPAGGAVVSLSSDRTAATVPATVTVPEDSTSANFTINTTGVGTSTLATITGTYAGSVQSSTLTVNPPGVLSLALNPDSVVGGSTATGTVTLTAPAPAGGLSVGLSSSNTSAAQVPASVTVAANATTATFTISTTPVGAYASLTITASTATSSQSAGFTVTPAPVLIESVVLNPNDLVGGTPSTGTVTLSGAAPTGGAVVPLSSSNPQVASVPNSITVPAGSLTANFTVTTFPVSNTTLVTIYGTSENVTRNATLNVRPGTTTLASVALNPTSVVGGSSSTGTVTLNTPAPTGGATVALSSNNGAAQVPASVTVAANATTATFTTNTSPVANTTPVTISGTYGSTQTAGLTVLAPTLSALSLNQGTVAGGTSVTATVTLNGPAPTGGAVVSLSSNNAAAQTPGSVTIAANATSATFTVTTSAVGASVTATITATYNGSNSNANLNINPPGVSGLALNPTSVVGRISSTGTVTLNSPAPAGGALVSLSSNNAAAQVPATVTVAANATTATFTATTTDVTSSTTATITASYNGNSANATLTVTPRTVTGLTLNPTSVVGGSATSTGTVTLSSVAPAGGTVVTLSSNNAAAQVPASVTVAANATTATFTVTTTTVSSSTTATITAAYNSSNRTANLTITPRTVSGLSMNPTSVVGGSANSTGTVTLSAIAPVGGAVVTLSSNNAAAQVPASVTVPANSTSATFTVTTSTVSSSVTATITASYNSSSRTATLTVTPRTVSALSLNPTSVVGSRTSTGTVTLSAVAPAGGAVVTLSSSDSSAQVPASVTVPANATSATFTITTIAVASNRTATITASYNSSSRTATLTVTTPNVASLVLNPDRVSPGATSTATVTLGVPAPSGGLSVSLSSSNGFVASVPNSVTVSAGSTTATFTVRAFLKGKSTITGTVGSSSASDTLTVR